MRNSGIRHIVVVGILGAYLAAGILSSRSLPGLAIIFKLDNSSPFQNEQSTPLDGRPFWTSHKHVASIEKSSDDQFLSTSVPWISVITPNSFSEIPVVFVPTPIPIFPPNPLRAPPLS